MATLIQLPLDIKDIVALHSHNANHLQRINVANPTENEIEQLHDISISMFNIAKALESYLIIEYANGNPQP